LSGGISSWNNKVVEKSFEFFVELNNLLIPMSPFTFDNIIVVIENLSCLWEFKVSSGQRLDGVGERDFIFIKRGSEGPHSGEDEESFIDLLDSINLSIFLQSL